MQPRSRLRPSLESRRTQGPRQILLRAMHATVLHMPLNRCPNTGPRKCPPLHRTSSLRPKAIMRAAHLRESACIPTNRQMHLHSGKPHALLIMPMRIKEVTARESAMQHERPLKSNAPHASIAMLSSDISALAGYAKATTSDIPLFKLHWCSKP